MVSRLLLVLAATLVVATPARAASTVAAPGAGGGNLTAATAGDGRVLLAWDAKTSTGRVLRIRDRAPDGTLGPIEDVLFAGSLGSFAVAVAPNGSAVALAATGGSTAGTTDQVVLARRAAGTAAFGAPEVVAGPSPYASVVAASHDADGELAAVLAAGGRALALTTAAVGGSPVLTDLGPSAGGQSAAVAVARGRVLLTAGVAAAAGSQILVRRGVVGRPLGDATQVDAIRSGPNLVAALDDAGTASVAYTDAAAGNQLVVKAVRARAAGAFGRPQHVLTGPNVQVADLAAAGRTTVLGYVDLFDRRVTTRIATATGTGAFGDAQSPGAPEVRLRGEAGRFPSASNVPHIAVDRNGSVLVTTDYGHVQAVHAVVRPAGAARFGAPRVLSPLGRGGGAPVPLLLPDGPFAAWATGDEVLSSPALAGSTFHPAPPTVRVAPLSASGLREGTVRTTATCATACAMFTSARITTGDAAQRGASGQQISRQGHRTVVLAAGRPSRITFVLPERLRTALRRTRRGKVSVLVSVAGVSGTQRTARVQVAVGARR